MKYPLFSNLRKSGAEPWMWLGALTFLAVFPPGEEHFSFCLFHHAGIHWCPGCGIGRSIALALQGNFQESFHGHILGIPAIFIVGFRIVKLLIFKPLNFKL